jgi:hypothetical protein
LGSQGAHSGVTRIAKELDPFGEQSGFVVSTGAAVTPAHEVVTSAAKGLAKGEPVP